MKNTLKKILSMALILVLSIGMLTGCNKTPNTADFLEVYVWDAGYGTKWLDEELKAFVQKDWVKQKYPNVNYLLRYNDDQGYAGGRMSAEGSNSIDLFFAPDMGAERYALDLTDVLYASQVPGEEVTFKEKMLGYMAEAGAYQEDVDSAVKYYSMPYGAGMVGWIYNVTLFDNLELEVPNTTNELFALCETVKGWNGQKANYPYTYTIKSSEIDYAGRMTHLWWAQYDGVDGVDNFFNAIGPDGTRNSTKIFDMDGREKSLEVFKKLYATASGYFDESSPEDSFMDGQTKFIMGNGLIQGNGEWFSMEMSELAQAYKELGYDFEIGMMRYPVLSAIIDKTPSITSDEMLSEVIDDIDAGLSAATNPNVTSADYTIVKKARNVIVCPDSMASDAMIPNYAVAKDVAVDFLRFLSTNEANSIMAENTYGGMLPFDFELKKDNTTLHNKLITENRNTYRIQLDVSDIIHTEGVSTPSGKEYPMVEYGTFTPWLKIYEDPCYIFRVYPNLTPAQVISESNAYWLDNNAARFKTALSKAGLA